MTDNITKQYITYQTFGEHCNILVEKLKAMNINFKSVYGIPRGGMPLATHLSYNLNTTMIQDPFYLYANKNDDSKILICDDICDSGKTITKLLISLGLMRANIYVVTLYKKPRSIIQPDLYVKEYNNDDWIVFPWESNDTPIDKEYMGVNSI